MKVKVITSLSIAIVLCIVVLMAVTSPTVAYVDDCNICSYEDDGELCSLPGDTCWVVKPGPVVLGSGN